MITSPTPPEKLNEIYVLMLAEEKRRITRSRLRIFKWILILLFVGMVVIYPKVIMGKITEVLKPIILSTASGMISAQKAELTKAIEDLLPPGTEAR